MDRLSPSRVADGPIAGTEDRTAVGLGYAVLAYGSWGLFPLFWKQLGGIAPLELVAHRVCWAALAYLGLVLVRGRARELARTLAVPSRLPTILGSSLLIGINWLVFVYAISTARVMHASLGYFLNPLVSIVLGMVFLGERMRPAQWIAVAIAGLGVVQLASLAEGLPWIGVVLALSFGGYGLLRKLAPVDGLMGATIESLVLVPIAAVYLGWLALGHTGAMGTMSPRIDALLVCAGFITAAPLVWFANAARLLPLRTLGFTQYLAPTLQFALAVAVFGEPLGEVQLRGFACIWTALLVFVAESWWSARRAAGRETNS
jgi:chloramphenicol-sensitive protein RarD